MVATTREKGRFCAAESWKEMTKKNSGDGCKLYKKGHGEKADLFK